MRALLFIFLLLAGLVPVEAANRFWVGGTASWDATAGTKWATTSGGGGGSAVPTSTDDVFFDAASGAVTVTVSAVANGLSLTTTGFTGTIAGASNIVIAGNVNLSGSYTWSHTGTLAVTGTANINSGGKTLGGWSVSGATTKTLTSNLTVTGSGLVTSGTFDANDFNITMASFTSSNTSVRSVLMGNGTWTLNGTSGTIWDTSTTTNLSWAEEGSTLVTSSDVSNTRTITLSAAGVDEFFNGDLAGRLSFNSRTGFTGAMLLRGPLYVNLANFTLNGTSFTDVCSAADGCTIRTTGTGGLSDTAGTNTLNGPGIAISVPATGGATFNCVDCANVMGATGWTFTTSGGGGGGGGVIGG